MRDIVRKYQRRQALTFIELLVVIVILGIVFAMAVPSISTISRRGNLRRETRRLVSLMKLARAEAVSRSRVVELKFDLEQHVYRLDMNLDYKSALEREEAGERVLPEEEVIELPAGQVEFTAIVTYSEKKKAIYEDHNAYDSGRVGSVGRRKEKEDDRFVSLKFYPRGSVTGATVVLQTVRARQSDQRYMTIDLFSTTGKVEVTAGKPKDNDIFQDIYYDNE